MSMFVEYATLDDLAEFMGKPTDELPKGTEILIKRASEMICMAMRKNYDPSNPDHVELAKLATCSQCQNWLETETSPVANNNIASYSLGKLSITYADVDKYSNKICSSAARYLNYRHLLYAGM